MTDQQNAPKYDRDRYRVPRLEDILNDADTPDDHRADELHEQAEPRPTSDDFTAQEFKAQNSKSSSNRAQSFEAQDFGAQSFGAPDLYEKPKRKSKSQNMYSRSGVTQTERRWAMLAHASVILTLLVGLPSAGILTLATLFLPLGIYFYWRRKSEYVAFQALQAFTLQVFGTIGWLALLTVGMIVGVLVILALIASVIGILLTPFVVLAMIVFGLASFALPFGMIVYSMIAAFQTWQGVDYRILRIGKWIDNQMHSGFLSED